MNDVQLIAAAVVKSMVGHTIVDAHWLDADDDPDESGWCEHEYALITLDDGRTIRFGGWGHDAWGATVADVTGDV